MNWRRLPRSLVLDRMVKAINRWDIESSRGINYRSFESIFRRELMIPIISYLLSLSDQQARCVGHPHPHHHHHHLIIIIIIITITIILNRLVGCCHTVECQLWAVWALANLTTVKIGPQRLQISLLANTIIQTSPSKDPNTAGESWQLLPAGGGRGRLPSRPGYCQQAQVI